ncbi:MAG: rRNA large subunit methyltransferase I, partial [Atopobiaceae bacterium]
GFTCANVLEYLPALSADRSRLRDEGGPFDLVVLDPPAFTKSRGTVEHASRGYREINEAALRLLPRGGYLATCSCSHFMTTSLLRRAIAEAAHGAGVQLRQVEERQQAPDHPILWGVPETHYLDFLIFQVV